MEILGQNTNTPKKAWRFYKNTTPNKIIDVKKEQPYADINIKPNQVVALNEIEIHMNGEREPFQTLEVAEVTNTIPGFEKVEHLHVNTSRTGASWEDLEIWLKKEDSDILEGAEKLKSLTMFDKLVDKCKAGNRSWLLVRDLGEIRIKLAAKLKAEAEAK